MLMQSIHIAGGLAVAVLLGAMLFFSFVVAPLVFLRLEAGSAGRFIRELFPWYYLVIAVLGAIAAGGLAPARPLAAMVMAAVCAGGLVARQLLMPRINRHRDRMLAGDAPAGDAFARLHRLSVAINGVQIVAVAAVLVRLLLDGGPS